MKAEGPLRLRENAEEPLAASLLDAARGYRRPASSRHRILTGIGLPTAVAAGAAASAATITTSVVTKMMVVVATATVLAGGAVAYRAHVLRTEAPAREHVVQATAVRAAPERIEGVEEGGEKVAGAGSVAPSRTAARIPSSPRPAHPRRSALAPFVVPGSADARSSSSQTDPEEPALDAAARAPSVVAPAAQSVVQAPFARELARELALLDSAERAERRHDHDAALGTLALYESGFPHGALAAEAKVLRIAALLGSGDDVTARREARSFLAHYAPSPLAARVRSMLSEPSLETKELP